MCDRSSKKLQTIAESLHSMDEETGIFMSPLEFDGFESTGESSDLELAAEIGKALLERNHELEILLKTTQEFAEEEANQTLHLTRQVELLRDSNESKTRLCQQLDSQVQEITEKHAKLKTEHWSLQGRYRKAAETSETLEKKCEEYRDEIERLKLQEEERWKESQCVVSVGKGLNGNSLCHEGSNSSSPVNDDREAEIECLKDELDTLYHSFLDTNDKFDCERRRREEIESELNDVSRENEILRQRVIDLEGEILEWQDVAHRAEQYQKLADRYCSGWDLSSEDSNYTVLTFDTKLINVNNSELDSWAKLQKEVKNDKNNELDEHGSPDRDLTPTEGRRTEQRLDCSLENLSTLEKRKCNGTTTSTDVRSNNLSLLSELDIQYKEMVKRYEALLDKCRNEGKITDNPVRTKKVQRAIQTLSLDLSYITSPLSPTNKTFGKDLKCPRCSSASGSKSRLTSSNENLLDSGFDYRMMFAEIFTKLKESKDYDPSQNSDI